MISLIFQLTGGLLLASVFVTYPYPMLPVVGQKPLDLKGFLFRQIRALFGVFYLMIGYALPYLGYEYIPEQNKILYALFGIGVLTFISTLISICFGEFCEKRAKPYDFNNPPTYNIFHVIFNK